MEFSHWCIYFLLFFSILGSTNGFPNDNFEELTEKREQKKQDEEVNLLKGLLNILTQYENVDNVRKEEKNAYLGKDLREETKQHRPFDRKPENMRKKHWQKHHEYKRKYQQQKMRRAIDTSRKLWPNGEVFYKMDENTFSAEAVDLIRKSMKNIEDSTCITFKNGYNSAGATIKFVYSSTGSCYSDIGMQSGEFANLILPDGCFHQEIIEHEIMHALGFIHEQKRPDRSEYIKINWENVQHGHKNSEMAIEPAAKIVSPYDYASVMHYGPTLAAVDTSKTTMTALDFRLTPLLGNSPSLSFYDKMKIANAYKCAEMEYCTTPCMFGGFATGNGLTVFEVENTDTGEMIDIQDCKCTCPDGYTGLYCQKIVDDNDCGGLVNVTSGPQTISLTNELAITESKEMHCVWVVEGSQGKLIKTTIESINFPGENNDSKCNGHYLELRYFMVGQPGPRYCTSGKTDTVISKWGRNNMMKETVLQFYSKDFNLATTNFVIRVEQIDPGCFSNPCQHQGTCLPDGTSDSDFTCTCIDGFSGRHCEIRGDEVVSCDFKSKKPCFLKNETDMSNIYWWWNKGATPSPFTGPTSGHNDQFYMYIETTGRSKGEKAYVTYEEQGPFPAPEICLSLWYCVNGYYVKDYDLVSIIVNGEKLWSKRLENPFVYSANPGWNQINKTISTEELDFLQISIVGAVSNPVYGDFGLDDIKLCNGACPCPGNSTTV